MWGIPWRAQNLTLTEPLSADIATRTERRPRRTSHTNETRLRPNREVTWQAGAGAGFPERPRRYHRLQECGAMFGGCLQGLWGVPAV